MVSLLMAAARPIANSATPWALNETGTATNSATASGFLVLVIALITCVVVIVHGSLAFPHRVVLSQHLSRIALVKP